MRVMVLHALVDAVAGSGTRDDEKRGSARGNRARLRRVQAVE